MPEVPQMRILSSSSGAHPAFGIPHRFGDLVSALDSELPGSRYVCPSTVRTRTPNSSAISAFDRPATMSALISSSPGGQSMFCLPGPLL